MNYYCNDLLKLQEIYSVIKYFTGNIFLYFLHSVFINVVIMYLKGKKHIMVKSPPKYNSLFLIPLRI